MNGHYTFAISGCNGSGKTTICHETVASLKKLDINVGMVTESARTSHYLISGNKNPEMHLEVASIHVLNELRARRMYKYLVCDRSYFDFLTYAKIRFPDEFNSNIFIKSMLEFATSYKQLYSVIFLTSGSFGNPEDDPLRAKETVTSTIFDKTIREILREFDMPYIELERDTEINTIIEKIKSVSS